MARIDELASFSGDPAAVTRLYLSPEHKRAAARVAQWMREGGMTATIDNVGTVVGRYAGANPAPGTLLLGSHIDSVRNAGKYDGCLGVVIAIEAVAELNRRGTRKPFAIEVLAFGDEEGVRFPHTLTGSRALSGSFDPAALDGCDEAGITLRSALSRFGCDPDGIAKLARSADAVLGYIEVHIEQGPVLEQQGLPVGVVTAISGACRFTVEVTGNAGHAGTVPMPLRRDALAAAAEMVLAVETVSRSTPGFVATVGRLSATPGAVNVIASGAEFTIDARSPLDGVRRTATRKIHKELKSIASRRGVKVELRQTYDVRAATCDQRLIRQLTEAVERSGLAAFGLPSGAGHDGLAMVRLCPIGMLFVRCKGGISHHPDESVMAGDVELATEILVDLIDHVAPDGRLAR